MTLERVAIIADTSFAFNEREVVISRDSLGHLLVVGEGGRTIGILSPDGRLLTVVRGGDAGGKGFQQILALLHDERDSVYVVDFGRRLTTVFDPSLKAPTRTAPTPPFSDAMPLPGGRLLVAGSIPTAADAGLPLHVVRTDGSIERSFGGDSLSFRPGDTKALFRSIAPATDGGFWTATWTRYTIEHWSPSLQRTQVWTRSVDWFPPFSGSVGLPDAERPPTLLRRLYQAADGLLWVNIGVAAQDWRQTVPDSIATRERAVPTQLEADKYFDTVIEVIDPAKGEIVASTRFPGILGSIDKGPFVWRVRAAAGQHTAVEVFKMSLARQ